MLQGVAGTTIGLIVSGLNLFSSSFSSWMVSFSMFQLCVRLNKMPHKSLWASFILICFWAASFGQWSPCQPFWGITKTHVTTKKDEIILRYPFRYVAYSLPQTFACEAMRGILLRGWGITYMPVYRGFLVTLAWIIGTYIIFKRLVNKQWMNIVHTTVVSENKVRE